MAAKAHISPLTFKQGWMHPSAPIHSQVQGALLGGFELPREGCAGARGLWRGVWAGTDGRAPALVPWPCCGTSRALPSLCLHLCSLPRGFQRICTSPSFPHSPAPFGKRGCPGCQLSPRQQQQFLLPTLILQGSGTRRERGLRAGTGCSPRDECCWKALQQPSRRSLIHSNP